jgi:pimeloyl-ACP methyl ester carboxylesterase
VADMNDIEHHSVRVGGYVFDVLAAGCEGGEPVIALHGFPQTADAWRAQLRSLPLAGYRVVAVNQRGYSAGARPRSVDAYHVRHLADDVEGVADAFDLPTFHLVGHDWGGIVAWWLAARRPGRLRTVTSLSTPHPSAFAAAIAGWDQRWRSSYMGLFRSRLGDRLLPGPKLAGLRMLFRSSALPPARQEPYLAAAARDPDYVRAGLNWYRANTLGTEVRLPPIEVPTLFVWGSDDPAAGPAAAHGTRAHVAGPYRFVALRGVGHWIPETAAERLDPLLREHFSTAHDPAS